MGFLLPEAQKTGSRTACIYQKMRMRESLKECSVHGDWCRHFRSDGEGWGEGICCRGMA